MNEEKIRRLKVVPFSATDYSLGENLVEPNGTFSTDPVSVSNKLALFFQWPDQSHVCLAMPSGPALPCSLSHDQDELEPTELYLTLADRDQLELLRTLKMAVIRLELFRTCFEFRAEVLAVREMGESDFWDVVLAVPSSVIKFKQTRAPRVRVSREDRARLPRLLCSSLADKSFLEVEVLEIGLNSLVIRTEPGIKAGRYNFKTENAEFKADLVRITPTSAIFHFEWSTSEEFGRFFDIYRLVAFPDLVPRTPDRHSETFELYAQAGYFSQFTSNESFEDRKRELIAAWQSIFPERHKVTVDYLVVDQAGKACGASSLVRAFQHKGLSLWVFHQLCTLKNPSTLNSTEHLYIWRAEYLACFPEPLTLIAWFRSESRWLERIYIKFLKQNQGRSSVKPIRQIRGPIEISKGKLEEMMPGASFEKGQIHNRTTVCSEDFFGGLGPKFLNAAGILDAIVPMSPMTPDQMKEAGEALLQTHGSEKELIHFNLNSNDQIPWPGFEELPSNRFCSIAKEDLFNFIASVEHSMAITMRKSK